MSTTWALDRRLALTPGADGTSVAVLEENVLGFGGLHGGHLAAVLLRAMQAASPNPHHRPLTLMVSFLRPTQPGRLDITADIVSVGRNLTSMTARLSQGEVTTVTATANFGAHTESLRRHDRTAPDAPPPERCEPLGIEPVPGSAGLQIAHRPALGGLPLSGSQTARAAVWMRLADDRPVDELTAVVLADGAVPALFFALDAFSPMPTVELTIHFADIPSSPMSPWLLGQIENTYAADGWAVEDGELWTPSGELVLVARQLRRLSPT